MSDVEKDEAREERIDTEIVVDAHGEDERALGWYYYLKEQLHFPFRARCIAEGETSGLRVGDKVEVLGMASEAECAGDMLVRSKGRSRTVAVPLAQLEGVKADEETKQGIEDWQYWVARGYSF